MAPECVGGGAARSVAADDMGLGKTLQGLAFLTWLRQGMDTGTVPSEPILVVAPTGLLVNWQKEHAEHLSAPGLGQCLPGVRGRFAQTTTPRRNRRTSDLGHLGAAQCRFGFCQR